jgi:hypothetical protein
MQHLLLLALFMQIRMAVEMEKSMARKIKRSQAAAASLLSSSPSMPRSARNLEAVAVQVAHDHELLRWGVGDHRGGSQSKRQWAQPMFPHVQHSVPSKCLHVSALRTDGWRGCKCT